jgi:WD40 repeat protein
MAIPVSFWGLAIVGFWFWRLVKGSPHWRGQAVAGYVLFAAMALFSSSLAPTPDATASPTAVPTPIRDPERRTAEANPPVPIAGLRQLSDHDATVVAWSPDGNTLVTGSVDKTVSFWQADSGQLVATLHLSDVAYAAAWSPNGRTLAIGSQNGDIELWDTRSHKLRMQIQKPDYSLNTSLVWSRDGNTLAGASSSGTIRLWRASTGRLLSEVTDAGQITSLAWSPDGKMLASGSLNRGLSIWTFSNGKLTSAGSDGIGTYSDWWVAWRPDGKMLAISGTGPGIKLVKIGEQGAVWRYETMGGHSSARGPIAWSPDSKQLANATDDNKVILWDVGSKLPVRVLNNSADRVEAIAWSPEGKTLAIANNNNVLLWQVDR